MTLDKLSRRDFIKKTSAATAGTLVAASAALADEKKPNKSRSTPQKFLIIMRIWNTGVLVKQN